MQIFSTFQHTTYIEMAITALQEKGIKKENIFAVPLQNPPADPKLFDTMHHSDGVSLSDIGMVLATAFSVIGASIGFSLKWGPIYWGLIYAAAGFILGFVIKLIYYKKNKVKMKLQAGLISEVILIVECLETQVDSVEHILNMFRVMGIGKVANSLETTDSFLQE
ncbi:hypothetical protein [Falsibacillus pallidus]|uniref:Uncharacterized protein n=1 Tax=Falsibacillus pallidus TaxID=493781 RepID=A0A370GPW7_9BACI|nr:hypothetical protein [Falsibacillus pallidus]RDI45768.1 hypothetical protein DFR59_102402 [Falsibacillus pallidus]